MNMAKQARDNLLFASRSETHIFPEKKGDLTTEQILDRVLDTTDFPLCFVGFVAVSSLDAQDNHQYSPQSGETSDVDIVAINCTHKEENVTFSNSDDCYAYNVKSAVDQTRTSQDTGDISLNDFFKRPIKIASYNWSVGTTFYQTLNPWDLFITDSRVVNRISNYNMMRGNLNVRVVVNGNSFHYGRLLTSYLPLHTFDNITQHRSSVPAEMVQESQQPHIFVNPTQSSGGHMTLPFFWHENYVSLTTEPLNLGLMTLRSFNILKHANGADDPVTISIFAWFDNIELTQLTSVNTLGMTPQSGEIDEANRDGMISTPATTVAKVAGKLSRIPQIAPYALATQTMANTVAGVARAFGYSRPSQTKDPPPFKPLPFSDLAPTTTPDGSRKLTVDDKQELTIDTRIAGIESGDPLSIKDIAKRESYVTQFPWPQTGAPESFLFNMAIDPCLFAVNPGVSNEYFLTASAAAATPFKYWTGSMRVRFQFVCSAYHRGRVKIVYDPNFITATDDNYNTNYVHIVDIAEKQDFTVEIGPAQTTTLMEHALPGITSSNELYTQLSPFTTRRIGNGVLGVYVLNELTTPNSTVNNDISVNVFVSMGDDFEVFVPDDHFQSLVWNRLQPQSGMLPQSGEMADPTEHVRGEEDKPQQQETTTLGKDELDTKWLNTVFTGESISSFRQMIKRFNMHTSLASADQNSARRILFGRRTAFPYYRGYVPGAVDETSAGENYNYCNTVMLHWVTMMFQGYRGSVRWKIVPRGKIGANGGDLPLVYVARITCDNDQLLYSASGVDETGQYGEDRLRYHSIYSEQPGTGLLNVWAPPSGTTGAAGFNGFVNPNSEFEVPFYDRYRFSPGKREDYMNNNGFHSNGFIYRIFVPPQSQVSFDAYCAAGEDFQAYFFTGLPGLFHEAVAPASI